MLRIALKKELKRPLSGKARNRDSEYWRTRLVSESGCTLWLWGDKEAPYGLWIVFSGMAASLPSNELRTGLSNRTSGIIQGMTDLLRAEQIKQGLERVKFSGFTKITILCGEQPGAWDKHNTPKLVGDWLQDREIIENDSKAEILSFKKEYYPDVDEYRATTLIIIQPQTKVLADITRGYIAEIVKTSKGYKYIG